MFPVDGVELADVVSEVEALEFPCREDVVVEGGRAIGRSYDGGADFRLPSQGEHKVRKRRERVYGDCDKTV